MRHVPLFSVLTLGLLAVGVAVNGADRSPAVPEPLKLPTQVACAAVCGDQLFGVTTTGTLLTADLKSGTVRNLDAPGGKLLAVLDVADGKACIADENRVYVVSVVDGKTVRSVEYKGKVRGVGFAGDDRLFVHEGKTLTVLDAAGKVLHTIALVTPEVQRLREAGPVAFHRAGRLLYTSTGMDGHLRIVDLVEGKLLDRIETKDWQIVGVCVNGDTAHVLSYHLSYGIWTGDLTRVDLKTKKQTSLERPKLKNLSGQYKTYAANLLRGPGETLVVTAPTGAWAYNSEGKITSQIAEQGEETCLGIWNGQALLADKAAIRFVKLDAARAE